MESVELLKNNGVDIEKSLELFGDMETYNDTIGEFLLGANEKLPKLEMFKNNKDMSNYAIIVHSLKSDAKYFGFTKLAELAYEHEMKSKENDYYYVYSHYDELMTEANRIVHLVKQYMGQEPVTNMAVQTENTQRVTENDSQEEVLTMTEEGQAVEHYNEKTILVADDSNIVRNFVRRIFEGKYKVGAAKDGREAIDLIEANKDSGMIVGLLLDLNMPEVDGFAVLEYMKQNKLFTNVPVSIISGDSTKATIDKAYVYPIVDMLGKPFNESDVKSVVEKTIYMKELNS